MIDEILFAIVIIAALGVVGFGAYELGYVTAHLEIRCIK